MTASDAGLRYSVSPRTIQKWAKLGQIDCVRIGRRCVRYPIESIDTFIRLQTDTNENSP